MGTVNKRAAQYVAKTRQKGGIPYNNGAAVVSKPNPRATVKSLTQGIIKGPTSN